MWIVYNPDSQVLYGIIIELCNEVFRLDWYTIWPCSFTIWTLTSLITVTKLIVISIPFSLAVNGIIDKSDLNWVGNVLTESSFLMINSAENVLLLIFVLIKIIVE